ATLRGDVRYVAPGGALAGPDYPSADTRGCANYKSDDADAFIPSSIANDFFSFI
uniref:Uncharacterized protein n=1 Tax=Plectus sambesii TaxID=2011161 RepID=A0A914VRK8_9BILA